MRKVISAVSALAISGVVSFVMIGSARAASVEPTVVAGNPGCADVGITNATEIKIEPPATTGSADGFSVSVVYNADNTGLASFTAAENTLVLGVIVKGGEQGANFYDYRPDGTQHDTDLVTPDNPNGEPAGLSHTVFCVTETPPPTTPPPTTPPPTTPPPTKPPPTTPPATTPSGAPQTGAGGTADQPFPMALLVLGGVFAVAAGLAALRRRGSA
jgi:hypothetical protein